MGLFGKLKEARPNDFGRYLEEGLFKLLIQKVHIVNPRSGGEAFTVEAKVLETTNPKFKIGEIVSWQCHSKHDSAASNMKHFLAKATGVEFDDVDEAGAAEVCSAANPLANVEIYALARNIKTRAGKDFTKVSWSLEPFTGEQIAAADKEQATAAQASAAPATPAAPAA